MIFVAQVNFDKYVDLSTEAEHGLGLITAGIMLARKGGVELAEGNLEKLTYYATTHRGVPPAFRLVAHWWLGAKDIVVKAEESVK